MYLKIPLYLFISLAILTLYSSQAIAEFRFSDGTKIEIQWYEKEGQILEEHVCFNYKDDDRKYRQCRKMAEDYFEEECEYYEDKIRNTPRKYRSMYEPELNKFCTASENYQP